MPPDLATSKQAPRAVLLVNTGSPEAPTRQAVARYLAEFLGDPRVVELSPWIWKPILHGIIIPRRAAVSAARYRSVWSEEGSPLMAISAATAQALEAELSDGTQVSWAMCYGARRVDAVLPALLEAHPEGVIVLPLYAQYATQTTAAVYDALDRVLRKTRSTTPVIRLGSYFNHPAYIRALAQSVRAHWASVGELPEKGRLLMSFHGIPKASSLRGDPYEKECQETAKRLAQELNLMPQQWTMAYQSKFGRAEWLGPATLDVAGELGRTSLERLDVICPGFSADCLETIEEIGDELKKHYAGQGGQGFHYIPALNATPVAIKLYAELVRAA